MVHHVHLMQKFDNTADIVYGCLSNHYPLMLSLETVSGVYANGNMTVIRADTKQHQQSLLYGRPDFPVNCHGCR